MATADGDRGARARRGGLVCVTGGSGFIGSWLVRRLLDNGYTVHATVKNLQDEGETKHLRALDGADARLRLFQMDLLDPASARPAVEGVHGVFHLASPVIVHPTQDPENELLLPAVNGTLNVLRAAKDCGVSRVVMVSSQSAMVPNPDWPADKVVDEDSWAHVELLKKLQHGEDECRLNAIEACVIRLWPQAEQHFPFIHCNEHLALTQKWGAWQSCFHETGLAFQPVIDCYNSGYGRKLELQYAAETYALQPPHQFVPWVVVNGRPLGDDYTNFEAYICNAYDGELPEACRGKHLAIAQHTRASRGDKRNPQELAIVLAICVALWF